MFTGLKNILFCLFILSSLHGLGQGLQIQLDLKQAAGREVVLANHYLGNIYAKDTIQLDETGNGAFVSDTLLPQGLYKIFLNENTHFDFLLGADQQFLLKNETFSSETMQIEGSKETGAFAAYSVFLKDLQQKGAGIRKQLETASATEKQKFQNQLLEMTSELHSFWDKLALELPESFLAKFVRANYVPALDVSRLPAEIQSNDSLLLLARFHYQQQHFWDNFDYTDERFLYTPFFKNKLETWFTKVLYQNYDSVKNHVFSFLEEVKPHKRIFQFAASYFLNSSINSNIMGMDALFVDLARTYYFSGEAFWATEESMKKIRENVLFSENNLIGKIATDLTLESFDGEYFNLYQVQASYTLVLLFEPGCSHCKEFVPELYSEVYQVYKEKGLEVFAIYTMVDKEEWGAFLAQYNLYDWINVWDETHASRFKILYDARKTPGLYVLNEKKEIVAKRMTVEQVKKFMERELN